MTVKDLAKVTDPFMRRVAATARRFVVTGSRAIWQLTGVQLLDGNRETFLSEVFSGIGFYSRPSATGKPEAVTVAVGGANAPVIVATRDEQTRASVADLSADETAIFNSQSTVVVKDDGTIEARSSGGVAVPLATLADLQALRSWCSSHVHTSTLSGTLTTHPEFPTGVHNPAPDPDGTSILKGE